MPRLIRPLLALALVTPVAARAADPAKTYSTTFGLSTPIYAVSNTIGVGYYGWEGTTVFGHTLWAFTTQQYSDNLANGCFWWTPSASCSLAGTNIAGKPYGAANSPYLPGQLPGPQSFLFGWAPGTEVIFAIMVDQLDGYNWFFSGDPSRNDDGLAHLAFFSPTVFPNGVPGDKGQGIVPQTAGLSLFGFEDVTYQHSDWDFDNLLFSVDGGITPPTDVVPEPATLTLLGTGLGALAAFRRRRRTGTSTT